MPESRLWDQVMWGEMVSDQQHGLPCVTGRCPKKDVITKELEQHPGTAEHPSNPLNEIVVWDAMDWL